MACDQHVGDQRADQRDAEQDLAQQAHAGTAAALWRA
jgi:hypothetical protein